MKRYLLALLCLGACAPAAKHPTESPDVVPASLDVHVAMVREGKKVGIIAKDLSSSPLAPPTTWVRTEPDVATSESFLSDPIVDLHQLGYAGVGSDGMCFSYQDKRADDGDSGEQVAKKWENLIKEGGIWVEAVDSLDALKDRAAWPPSATSVQLSKVTVLADARTTLTSHDPTDDNGGYVEVKRDLRVVTLGICVTKPEVSPGARFIVLLQHITSAYASTKFDDKTDSGEFLDRRHATENDALFVWALTDDGTFDL